MRLLIPTIGTHLKLNADWTFPLHRERRNNGLRKRLSMPLAGWSQSELSDKITIPAETILVVDRIYIRQQAESFDSITFRLHSSPDKRFESGRFWAKLKDVNAIECELDPPTTPGLTGKSILPPTVAKPKGRFGITSGYKPGDRVVVRGFVKAGVGIIRKRDTEHGRAYYIVALPLMVGKVRSCMEYADGKIQPGITYGCQCDYTDMRLATPDEIAEQEATLAKGRKRRVAAARKLLKGYETARAGNVLTDTEMAVIENRNKHAHPDGWRQPDYVHPHTAFIRLQRGAHGDVARTAAIELAVAVTSPRQGWPHHHPYANPLTDTEHKLMAAVQQGYLGADETRPALRDRALTACGDLFRPLWIDGKPITADLEEIAVGSSPTCNVVG